MSEKSIHKISSSPEFQIALIVTASAILLSVFSLSAQLIDYTDPVNKKVTVKLGDEFGISLSPPDFNEYKSEEIIFPGGDPIPYNLVITNDGDYDIYTFIEITTSDADFKLNSASFSDWSLILEEPNRYVYAYGSLTALTPVQKRQKINGEFESNNTSQLNIFITLDERTDITGGTYTVSAVSFAIQTEGLKSQNPEKIWSTVEEKFAESIINDNEETEA